MVAFFVQETKTPPDLDGVCRSKISLERALIVSRNSSKSQTITIKKSKQL